MIVDITIPIIDKTYDFSISETVSVNSIIEEIVEMIERREACFSNIDYNRFSLFSSKTHCQLDENLTLVQNGIENGQSLLLV